MARFTGEDDVFPRALGVEVPKQGGRTPREERVVAGFEDIQRFVERHGRAPRHGEGRSILERLHAVRLDRLRALEECRALLGPLDHQGLLADAAPAPPDLDGDEARRRITEPSAVPLSGDRPDEGDRARGLMRRR